MDDVENCFGNYFTFVSQMCFDKARELVERERDVNRPGMVKTFFVLLYNFTEAERSYCNLGFLSTKNKIFHRKDNSLKSIQDSLRLELQKFESVSISPIDTPSVERLLGPLASQLTSFLIARQQLSDLYEKMYLMSTSSKRIKYEELTNQIQAIIDGHRFAFAHPLLEPIKNSMSWECDLLLDCLRAQMSIESWDMVPSLVCLHSLHGKLNQWERTLQIKESWKLGFGSSFLKPSSQPQLIQWFNKLRAHLINKFTFYFYQMLAQNTAPGDMKTYLSSKNNTDLFLKFQSVQRKCFACAVLLMFDTKDANPSDWSGPSYQHPERIQEPGPQFLVMCAHPLKFVDRMPNVVRALNERNPEVLNLDKFSFVYDTEEKCSYVLSSVEPRVTFVAIFDGKKDEKDASTMNYLIEFCTQARGTRVFSSLKPSK